MHGSQIKTPTPESNKSTSSMKATPWPKSSEQIIITKKKGIIVLPKNRRARNYSKENKTTGMNCENP